MPRLEKTATTQTFCFKVSWVSCGLPLQELCIRNPLHRKKLQLALQAVGGSEEDDLQGKLNHNWVTREFDTSLVFVFKGVQTRVTQGFLF